MKVKQAIVMWQAKSISGMILGNTWNTLVTVTCLLHSQEENGFFASTTRLSQSSHQEKVVELSGASGQGTKYCSKNLGFYYSLVHSSRLSVFCYLSLHEDALVLLAKFICQCMLIMLKLLNILSVFCNFFHQNG